MVRTRTPLHLLAVLSIALTGCSSSSTAPPTTGFLSDYSSLRNVDDSTMRYISPRLSEYDAFIVDPVQLRANRKTEVTKSQQAEAAKYFRTRFTEVLEAQGYRVERFAGVGIARVRLALSDVQKGTWWMNLHPGSKLTGAGTGGASMEGEVIDSVTGELLGAVVRSGRGNQFELDTFDDLDDIKDVIDQWAEEAGNRLRELRSN